MPTQGTFSYTLLLASSALGRGLVPLDPTRKKERKHGAERASLWPPVQAAHTQRP